MTGVQTCALPILVDADRFVELDGTAELVESRVNRFGQEIMRVYRGVDE